MEDDDSGYELTTIEDVKKFLRDNYPDQMVVKKIDEFDRVSLIGAQLLANELLYRLGE